MTTAKKHHYVSQGYLAAFTDTGTKEGQFNVLDVDSQRTFRTSPINVAAERDFNRVDIKGQPADALESALGELESTFIEAIRKVLANRKFPAAEDFNGILNLLGLFAVRNPRHRASFNRAREHTLKIIADMLVSDRRLFEKHLRRAAEAGDVETTNLSFEDAKNFVEAGFSIDFPPESNSRVEFAAFDKLLPILGQRTWSIFLAPESGPEFICCDHPVTLVHKNGQQGPVGFGSRRTEVFFPLGRTTGLYGTFEQPLPIEVTLKPLGVATMNLRVAMNAERHLFSALDQFVIRRNAEIVSVGFPATGRPK
jgi:hypothetical protein